MEIKPTMAIPTARMGYHAALLYLELCVKIIPFRISDPFLFGFLEGSQGSKNS
jgi:hypothetical protein